MIPTYNQETTILRAIDSALQQTYSNLEVIVADDCSQDLTAILASSYNEPRLRYYRNSKNLGRVKNYRNTLYSLASGEWVVNLDGDDYFTDPEFITYAIKVVMRGSDIVVVAARCLTKLSGCEFLTTIPDKSVMSGIDVVQQLHDSSYHFSHMATLYHRNSALDIDFYRYEVLSTDWESLYRLVVTGKIGYLDRVVGVWNLDGNNLSLTTDWRILRSNLNIWKNIYNEAIQHGLSTSKARLANHRALYFMANHQLSRIVRSGDFSQIWHYLISLHELGPILLFRTVLSYRFIAKILLLLFFRNHHKQTV